jgi:2'-5' RNA ligase
MGERMARRSAVVAPIEIPPLIERLRYAETADARRGVPAHVTLLFPFFEPPSIDERVLATIAGVVRGTAAFDVEFREVRRWPPGGSAPQGVVWLAPDSGDPFRALTQALWDSFPDHPPYEGRHDEVVPHLTLAVDDASHFDAVAAEAGRHLPFERRVDAVVLLVEGFDGQWRLRARFALGERTGKRSGRAEHARDHAARDQREGE